MFKEITIIGMGFMGSSIAGAVKAVKSDIIIKGADVNEKNVSYCLSKNLIDLPFDNNFHSSDLVILSIPPKSILQFIEQNKNYLEDINLLTDIGSIKKEIAEGIKGAGFNRFVGSHPLCGSDKDGPQYADAFLFNGKTCVVMNEKNIKNIDFIEKVASFWKMLGMKIVYADPDFHDNIIGYSSHLPHLVAFSLSKTVLEKCENHKEKEPLKFISSGFKDSTRIASSSSRIWTDIFLMNRDNILASIDDFLNHINEFRDLIENKDEEGLKKLITDISNNRRHLD
jgi:prephenate dehydrogenase